MKYTLISTFLTRSQFDNSKQRIDEILADAKGQWASINLGIYLFRTKEGAKAVHQLSGFFMQWGIPFVSIQTDGPVTLGLKADQYSEIEKLGVEIHKLVLSNQ